MNKKEFVSTHCYMCSCVDCPQTATEVTNCYKKIVENETNKKDDTVKSV